MKEVLLTKGYVAIVDDEDYEKVSAHRWYAHVTPEKNVYAVSGYRRNSVITRLSMHRFVMGCQKGDGKIVDHKNGNTLDNQKGNLRIASASGSAQNVRKSQYPKSSRYKGVYFDREEQRWRAQIKANRRLRTLGRFKTEREAAIAYNNQAIALHGEYASLNQIED